MKNKWSVTRAIVQALNQSFWKKIEPAILIQIFKTQDRDLADEWSPHLNVLFSEISHSFFKSFLEENDIPIESVNNIFHALPEVLQNKYFKEFLYGELGKVV